MANNLIKKRLLLSLFLLISALSLFVVTTISWIKIWLQESETYEVGDVDVEIQLYFVDSQGNPVLDEEDNYVQPPLYLIPNTTIYKPGVYVINVINISQDFFFSNLRANVIVNSTVDTYFRIKIIEELTMKYVTSNTETELAIPLDDFLPFVYETANWHFASRFSDDYIYYKLPVKGNGVNDPLSIPLISSSSESFIPYSIGYSLQLSFVIEAIQAQGGPQENWGLATPPWGGSW